MAFFKKIFKKIKRSELDDILVVRLLATGTYS